MDRQTTNESNRCKYKENYKRLKEQFINGINDKGMTNEIIEELTSTKNISEVPNEQVLLWDKWVEVQRLETVMLNSLKENRDLMPSAKISKAGQKGTIQDKTEVTHDNKVTTSDIMDLDTNPDSTQCSGCSKQNHFKNVCRSRIMDNQI